MRLGHCDCASNTSRSYAQSFWKSCTLRSRSERNGDGPSILDDAVSALVNLGYKPAEARRAVDSVGASEGDGSLESLLRKSLAVILGEK